MIKLNEYILQLFADVLYLSILIICIILYGTHMYNTSGIVLSIIIIISILSFIKGIYASSLNENILYDRCLLIELCANSDKFDSYLICKMLLGYGAIAYICYITNALMLAICLCVLIVSTLLSAYLVQRKNNMLFTK